MTWERFAYICRKANGTFKSDESISECISRIESEPSCSLYGEKIKTKSMHRKILDDVKKITDHGKARQVLKTYSEIDLSHHLTEPMQLKRVTIYLAYVTFIFFIVSAIYQFKVAPSFLEAFNTFELAVPSHLLFYRDYWHYVVLVIAALLVLSLIIGFTLRGLFNFQPGRENSFVLKFLAFKGIRESYLKLIDVLSFPLSSVYGYSTSGKSEITEHLSEIENSDMSIAIEMKALIRAETQTLMNHCEKQMRAISVFVAIIIVAAIFFFLVSAYSPIFVLGEAV